MNQDLQIHSLQHENRTLLKKLTTAEEELLSLRRICNIPEEVALHAATLTTREREVFNLLVSREWVSCGSLETVLWPDECIPDEPSNTIRQMILALRRKVGKNWLIENVRGAGYKMTKQSNKGDTLTD